ncbi:hypothetical protein HanHA300_Chr14g0523601 [Helianthus annuus]|nr:hypothetical protein HanHA300_Chr14g0523601 [Helianthus annuus]
MEARYSKLYDKYTKLKVKKASETEQLSLDQEEKFKTYVSGMYVCMCFIFLNNCFLDVKL